MILVREKVLSLAKCSSRLLYSFSKKKDGFQMIDYSELEAADSDLEEKFTKAFGKGGIGAILVRNIPDLLENRAKVDSQLLKFASLSNEQLNKLSRPQSNFQQGWSERNQQIYGRVDRSLGIFKARISPDDKYLLKQSQVDKLPKRILSMQGDNVWPWDGYKKNFLSYQQIIQEAGLLLLNKLEKHIEQQQPYVLTNSLSSLLKRANQHSGSSFFSYPSVSHEQLTQDWEFWHTDHSLLQGLSSTVYLDNEGKEVDYFDQDAGLHTFSSTPDKYVKVRLDNKSILFKAGEVLQILSGGVIYPKPHRLIRGNFLVDKQLSITYWNTAIQPNFEEKLNVPAGVKVDSVLEKQVEDYVPALSERWDQGITYGEFVQKTLKAYSQRK